MTAQQGFITTGTGTTSPQAARFTTVDPIRDGNNWFAYVNNDPVNYVDLWGESATVVFGIVGFVSSAGSSIISDLTSTGKVNWTNAIKAGVGGAAKGIMMGLVFDTFGAAVPVIVAAAPPITALLATGAMSNVVGGAITDMLIEHKNPWTAEKVVTNAVYGVAEVMVDKSIETLGKTVTNMMNQKQMNYIRNLNTANIAPLTINYKPTYNIITNNDIVGNTVSGIVGQSASVLMDVYKNNNVVNSNIKNK